MSRMYSMDFRIENFFPSKTEEIKKALLAVWISDPNLIDCYPAKILAVDDGSLSSGGSEEDLVKEARKHIWEANGAPCKISIKATLLENLPYEEYTSDPEKDEDLVADFWGNRRSAPEKVKILNEYVDKVCDDINFNDIYLRTGIDLCPRTKHSLCEAILELGGEVEFYGGTIEQIDT